MREGIFGSAVRIDGNGIRDIEPLRPENNAPVKPVIKTTKPPKRKKTSSSAVKEQMGSAVSLLEGVEEEDREVTYEEKMECFIKISRAMDSLRHLITDDEKYGKEEIEPVPIVWKECGYYVEKTDLGIKLVLPPVWSKKASPENISLKQAERRFAIHDMAQFFSSEKMRLGITESFLKDQVLIFTHERTEKGQFDYDNLSTSSYINAISDAFLAADNAENIDFFQRFVRGEENRTIVSIISKENYPKWVKQRYS